MNEAREYRVFGSPGTGKTTYLTSQIQEAASRYGADRLFVASFTRAAAHEVAGRNKNVQNVGTLHAHGYRAIGGTRKVAESMLDQWNEEQPHYALSGGKQTDIDECNERGASTTTGDELYSEMNLNRALLIPRERWRLATQAFDLKWRRWKQAHGIIDYTDMIEIPYRDIEAPPGHPSIGFFDEAQDFTPMELALVRKWGKELDYIILAGDDDQCIYEWAGARPDVLIKGEPTKKVVLKQSYRVPKAVHALAQKTILQVQTREPKIYEPRDAEGEVRLLRGVNSQTPEQIIRDIEKRYPDKTIMILSSCSYMLQGITKALRQEGIPFHNPYRAKSGAWNPLKRSTKDQISTIDRLLAFIDQVPREYEQLDEGFEHIVDIQALLLWYDILKVQGNIPKGKKNEIISELRHRLAREPDGMTLAEVWPLFEESSGVWDYWGETNIGGAVEWLAKNTISEKAKAMEFPQTIIQKRGVQALKDKPKIIVGTIHSVKGGEADVVYVIPDLSYGAFVEKTSSL